MQAADNSTPTADTRDTAQRVRRVTAAGLAINLLLCGAKFLAGIAGHSQAVVADAIHSLSDSATDIIILAGSCLWSRPPDDSHPYGHQRIETVVSIVIGLVLALAGVGLAVNALATVHGRHATPPGFIALLAALVSIVVKELLYRWTHRVGVQLHSLSLQANAWHHRSDALSSLPAALAVAGAIVFPEWVLLDHVGALVVSVFILQAAYRISSRGIRELVDRGAPGWLRDEILRIAAATEGVREAHALRTRYIGSRIQLDLHVLVDPGLTVRQGHDIAEAVSTRIRAKSDRVMDVVVHVEPYENA